MTPQQHQRVSEVFSAVVALEPSQRTAVLNQTCGDDRVLRQSVESLLRYHNRPAGLLDDPSFWSDVAPTALKELNRSPNGAAPARIGRYRILSVLGEGGMGVVYLAEQDRPRRTVALKVIRRLGASAELLRRFEFEQEALGRLQHPGIAQIFAADISEDGQPFFAMEYIIGVPLTDYASAHDLDIAQRLDVIAQICDAVQHAHQRGVIHRDLKPRNILVTQSGEPKILDFGVARAARRDGQAASQSTDSSHIVGTLAYMSPEQFDTEAPSVDARCDVYSLGVLLYELLTGQLPHDFRSTALHEAARIAHEIEPPAPGTIDRALRGDVETIIIKALEKDPARRYQSAAQLEDDIRRHLAGQPIIARQDSALYVLSKRLRRYRWAAAACIVFVTLLSLFAAYALWRSGIEHQLTLQERRARQDAMGAQREADLERDQAQRARDAERDNRKAAEANASRAQAVTAFFVETLGLADPDVRQNPEMKVDDLLDEAAAQVGAALADQPEAEAIIRTVIGKAYASQGELESADLHFRRALEIRRRVSPQDLEGLYEILWPYWRVLTDLDDINALIPRAEAIRIGQQIIEKSDPELGQAVKRFMAEIKSNFKASTADSLFEVASDLTRRLQADDPLWIYIADQWHAAGTGIESRDPAAAARYLSASLDIMRGRVPETNTRIVRTLEWLVRSKISAGDHAEAERLVQESLLLLSKVLPDDHWYVAVHHAWLGEALIGQARYEQAETQLLLSHSRLVQSRGLASGYTIAVLMDMVKLYDEWNRPGDAEHRRDELARAIAALVGSCNMAKLDILMATSHPELDTALHQVRAGAYRGKLTMEVVEQEESIRHQSIPDDHPYSACIADALEIWAKRNQDNGGKAAPSRRLMQACYEINKASNLRHPRKQANAIWYLSADALESGKFAEAERFARMGIDLLNSGPPERYGYTAVFESLLGGCLMEQGRAEEARAWLEHGFETLRDQNGPADVNTLVAAWRMVDLHMQLGQLPQAERFAMIATQSAMMNRDNGVYINRAAWRVARVPGFSQHAYEVAQDAVTTVLKSEPENGNWLDTLGAVQYRLGQFDDALVTLTRADQNNKGAMAEDAAFLCLTCKALGQWDAAAAWDAKFRQFIAKGPPNEFKARQWQMLASEIDGARK